MEANTTPANSAPGRGLFRPAAVQRHRRRLAGDIVLTEPRWLFRASLGFFGLLLGGATVAATWPIARVTKLEGVATIEGSCADVRRWPFESPAAVAAELAGRPAALTLLRPNGAPLGAIAGVFACAPQPAGAPAPCRLLFETPCAAAAALPEGSWRAEARVDLPPVTLARLIGARFAEGSDDANR